MPSGTIQLAEDSVIARLALQRRLLFRIELSAQQLSSFAAGLVRGAYRVDLVTSYSAEFPIQVGSVRVQRHP
jgi:hypothetical protein